MAKVLSKTGVLTGEQVDAWHVTQSIDAFTGLEAYNITVSGSFTLTGSLNLSGSLIGHTTGTSSISDTSSYSQYSETADYAITSSFNQNDIYTLQLNHSLINLDNSTTYFIGAGNKPTSNNAGIIIPVDSSIVSIFITITNETTGSSEASSISLTTSGGSIWSDSGRYDANNIYITGDVSTNIDAGEIVFIRLNSPSFSVKPFQTTHNIILTLLPYHQ